MPKIKDQQFYYYKRVEHQIKAYTKKHINTLMKHKLLIVSNVGTTT